MSVIKYNKSVIGILHVSNLGVNNVYTRHSESLHPLNGFRTSTSHGLDRKLGSSQV